MVRTKEVSERVFRQGQAAASRGDDKAVFEACKTLIALGCRVAADVLAELPCEEEAPVRG